MAFLRWLGCVIFIALFLALGGAELGPPAVSQAQTEQGDTDDLEDRIAALELQVADLLARVSYLESLIPDSTVTPQPAPTDPPAEPTTIPTPLPAPAVPADTEYIDISATALREAYRQRRAADAKYKGRWLRVTGVISSVLDGSITLDTGTFNSVLCDMTPDSVPPEFWEGHPVTVIGLGDGRFLGSPRLDECQVIQGPTGLTAPTPTPTNTPRPTRTPRPTSTPRPTDTPTSTPVPVQWVPVTAHEVLTLYQDNEIAGQQRFANKPLEISGRIGRPDYATFSNQSRYNLPLQSDELFSLVSLDCEIPVNDTNTTWVSSLSEGDTVTVRGYIRDEMGLVTLDLEECTPVIP